MNAPRIYCFERLSQYEASTEPPWEEFMRYSPAWDVFRAALPPRDKRYKLYDGDREAEGLRACYVLLEAIRLRPNFEPMLCDLYWRTYSARIGNAMRSANRGLRRLRLGRRRRHRRRGRALEREAGPSLTGFGLRYDALLFQTWIWMAREVEIESEWTFSFYLIDDTNAKNDDASSGECYSPGYCWRCERRFLRECSADDDDD